MPAIAAGKFADGRMMMRPCTSAGSRLADQPAERDLAFVFVAVIAGHQQNRRGCRCADC